MVLKKGEELFESLSDFAKQNKLKIAWFQGFGAAKKVELGYYHLDKKEYEWQKFDGPLEITGLHGNIVQKDGHPAFHAHGTFANDQYQTIGGHIKTLRVAGTCEILITKLDLSLSRSHDDEVGLDLINGA